MNAVVAAACAAGAAMLLAHRPARPSRLRRPGADRARPNLTTIVQGLGKSVRRVVGLRADPGPDRRAGWALMLVAVAVLAGPELALAGAAATALHGRWRRVRSARAVDVAQIERDLPDLVDLLSLAVGAGLSVPAALPVVAPVAPASLRSDLRAAVDAVAGGRPSDEAVATLGAHWGAPGRPLVHALADHLRYGTPVLPALERVAAESRTRRRRAAETRARKLPVLLLFPLVLCTLPAFGLLTVAPLVAGTFDSLSGGQLEAPASLGP